MMADQEGEVRWDGLRSREPSARDGALENIKQVVLKRCEAALATLAEENATPPAPAEEGLSPLRDAARSGLNQVLARLLMLSERCPFRDVREKSEAILKSVQGAVQGIVAMICCSMILFMEQQTAIEEGDAT